MTNAESCRRYYQANKERWKAYAKVNPERRKQHVRRWNKAHPERKAWHSMHRRCTDSAHKGFKNYGGRGIKVLYASFNEFLADVGKRPGTGYSIDRINNDGHYTKGNCRWATIQQQNRNRRT